MTNILLLLKVQLYSTFSLNDLRKGGFGKYFKFALLFMLVLLFSGYNLLTALSLVRLGQANLIPAYMIALVSFIIFFFSLMQSCLTKRNLRGSSYCRSVLEKSSMRNMLFFIF